MKKLFGLWVFVCLGLVVSCSSPECEKDKECQPGFVCQIGKCLCVSPNSLCAGRCVNVLKSDTHCGKCGNTCVGGQTCALGSCKCPNPQLFCGGSCVDPASSAKHSGKCGNECTGGTLCDGGKCKDSCPAKTPTICEGGCTDTLADSNHCGSCGKKCPDGRRCLNGKCDCPEGQKNCSGLCVNVDTTSQHCGGCGKSCKSGQLCASGRCVSSCPKSTPQVCFGGCVDTKTNRSHCGGCGTTCSKGKTCVGGVCQCPEGQQVCNNECVNVRSDQRHCGSCGQACAKGKVCDGGRCLLSCPNSTESKCFGGCFNTKSNPKHCGGCGKACIEGQICNSGKCECPSGFTLCDGKCIVTDVHPLHCGGCGKACPSGQFCSVGKCVTSCPAGQGVCYGGCIDTKNSIENCGGCGVKCGANRTCREGKCACPGERTDCAGACADVQTDILNCGTCGKRCQSGEKCVKGACKIVCDTRPFDTDCGGICVDVQSDKRHCNTCGNACTGRKICQKVDEQGKSVIKCVCPSGFTDCKGVCVNMKTDVKNCGKCGTLCGAGQVCSAGKCSLNCVQGETVCKGTCVNTQLDRRHCGTCDNICPGGATCSSGSCKCPGSRKACGGVCLNTAIDPNHCGACNNKCPTGQRCEAGKCTVCSAPATQCGSTCCPSTLSCCGSTNKTCVDLKNNYKNCGACGKSCKNSERCCGSGCIDILTDNKNCGACGNVCKTGTTCCNGTCTDLKTSKTHCGACGNFCDSDSDCCGGACKNLKKDANHCSACGKSCQQGEGCCGSSCMSLQQDNKNCGACGNVCKTGTQCCAAGCVDVQTSAKHCGACGQACPLGEACAAGKCKKSWAVGVGGVYPSSSDIGYSIGSDRSGNVYVMGRFYGEIVFGSTTLRGGNSSIFVVKFNSQFVVQWATSAVGSNLSSNSATFDNAGNTYIAGYFSRNAFFGSLSINSTNHGMDAFVAKVDSNGKWQWVTKGVSASTDYARAIALDGSGNVFVAGEFYSVGTFGTIKLTSKGSQDIFVAKLDSKGVWQSAARAGGTRSDYVTGIAVDKAENIHVTGYFRDPLVFGSTTLSSVSNSNDIYVAKVDKAGTWLWAQKAGGTSSDYGTSIKVDASGNAFVTGYFYSRPAAFGAGMFGVSLSSSGSADVFVAKLDSSGKWLWAKHFGSSSYDRPYDLSLDASGNAYVIGQYRNSQVIPSTSIKLVNRGSYDAFVTKIDTNGKWMWATSLGGPSSDYGYGLHVDSSGNTFASGYFYTGALFGSTTLSASGGSDLFVAKLDSKGSVTKALGYGGLQSSSDYGYSIAVDRDNNTYVTGMIYGSAKFGSINLQTNPQQGNSSDIFVAKLDKTGKWLWAQRFGSTSSDYGRGIAVDRNKNVFVTGFFRYTATFGTIQLTSKSRSYDIFVMKMDANGKVLWAQSAGSTSTDRGHAIATDKAGNAFVTGYLRNQATFGAITLTTNSGGYDIFVAKIDPTGRWLWAKAAGGTSSDYGYGIATDGSGNAVVTGYFRNSVTFGTSGLSSKGGNDIFVAKISATGIWMWGKSAGGSSYDYGRGVAVDSSDNIYATGYFNSTATFGTTTLKTRGGYDIYIAKLDKNGKWLWSTSSGGTSSDYSYGIALDSSNNVYATGYFPQNAKFGATSFSTPSGSCNVFVVKLDNDGKYLWAKTATSTNSGCGLSSRSIKLSSTNLIYTAGYFDNTVKFDANTLTSKGSSDIFVWQVTPK